MTLYNISVSINIGKGDFVLLYNDISSSINISEDDFV